MNRTNIENVLFDMGMSANNKGFAYIVDAVEIFEKEGGNIRITKELYPQIAKKYGTTPSRVERAIRHEFEKARSPKGNYDVAEKYIGFINCENSSSIAMLHTKLKQEFGDFGNQNEKNENRKAESVTASEIRQIIREELFKALYEIIKYGCPEENQ